MLLLDPLLSAVLIRAALNFPEIQTEAPVSHRFCRDGRHNRHNLILFLAISRASSQTGIAANTINQDRFSSLYIHFHTYKLFPMEHLYHVAVMAPMEHFSIL